jgi:hypothetical protein
MDRALVRIRERRARPVDLVLVSFLWQSNPEYAGRERVPVSEQTTLELLDMLTEQQLQQLQQNLRAFLEEEVEDVANARYIQDVLQVLKYRLKPSKHGSNDGVGGGDGEVDDVLADKSPGKLADLRRSIVAGDRLTKEPEFWGAVLDSLDYRLACDVLAHLDEVHRRSLDSNQLFKALLVLEAPLPESDSGGEEDKPTNIGLQRFVRPGQDNSPEALKFVRKFSRRPVSAPNRRLEEPLEVLFSHKATLSSSSSSDLLIPRFWAIEHAYIPWTKYNRAFYNRALPPPRHVTGYTFVLALPLLREAVGWVPAYDLQPDPSSSSLTNASSYAFNNASINNMSNHASPRSMGACGIIWFRLRTPYADVSFRIKRDAWGRRASDGFLCQWDPVTGIFVLKFHFLRRSRQS